MEQGGARPTAVPISTLDSCGGIMRTKFGFVVSACALSMALTLGCGLLLQPSPAQAQTPSGLQCIGGGVTGCYWCDPGASIAAPAVRDAPGP